MLKSALGTEAIHSSNLLGAEERCFSNRYLSLLEDWKRVSWYFVLLANWSYNLKYMPYCSAEISSGGAVFLFFRPVNPWRSGASCGQAAGRFGPFCSPNLREKSCTWQETLPDCLCTVWQSYTLPEHFHGLPSSSTTHFSNTSGNWQLDFLV